jgi:hypothetical protein
VAVRRPLTSTTWASPALAATIATTAARTVAGTWRRRPSAAPAMTAASSVIWDSSSRVPARPAAMETSSVQRAAAVRSSSRRSKGRSGQVVMRFSSALSEARGIPRIG